MKSTNKVIVGIFVGACLLLFGIGLFLIGSSNQLFTKSFHVFAEFSKITGIVNGGKVRVAGMDAGAVTKIEVPSDPGGKFRIYFRIVDKLHPLVRQDSVVTIQTDGLLGNKYLQVEAGSANVELAKDNSQIRSTEPFDWGDLMDEISNAVKQVNTILLGAKDQLMSSLEQIEGVATSANTILKDSTPQVKKILASADKIGANLNEIIDGVQQGQGTVGAIFKDEEMKASVKRSVNSGEKIVENFRETSASARKVVDKVEQSDIVPEVQNTVKELQQITKQIKSAVDKFQSATGEGGVAENLQRTLADANEAMSDLSDNTEALKHNFFFRGFFKKRGFYDLGSLTTPEYLKRDFGKGFKKHRLWLESADLFTKNAKGIETLTDTGKRSLDEAMTTILQFPRNGPLIVEGYAAEGTNSEQYLRGRQRAAKVVEYILGRFPLRAAYVGIVSMGAQPLPSGTVNTSREGVGIVSFYK